METNVMVTHNNLHLSSGRNLEHSLESADIIMELRFTAPFAFIKQVTYRDEDMLESSQEINQLFEQT